MGKSFVFNTGSSEDIKKIYLGLVLMLLTLTSSCQNKQQVKENKEMITEEFYWSESTSSPLGYPIDVY